MEQTPRIQPTDCRGPTALAMTYLVIRVIAMSITKYVIARSEATRQSVSRTLSLVTDHGELCHE
jgi:hypothetical protein